MKKMPNLEQHPSLEPIPQSVEKYMLGSIHRIEEIHSGDLGIPAGLSPSAIYELGVDDPYIQMLEHDHLNAVREHENNMDDYAKRRRESGYWQRKVGTAYTDGNGESHDKGYQWGDPVSHSHFFSELSSPALNVWLKTIPSAKALRYLSDPVEVDVVSDLAGEAEEPVDEMARLWLTACTDAVAIRSRGTVMADIVRQYINSSEIEDKNSIRWMSVACGTALPAMKAAISSGLKPDLVLVDNDEDAMNATQSLGEEIGFEGNLTQFKTNIFSRREMAKLREHLGVNGGRPRIIDLMGIFEYTGDMLGIDSSKFLKSNYDMLHPGGRLIMGQMRKDRPNPDFTMGVVGWPWIMMRTPAELMKVVSDAGIDPSETTLYLPEDGVYSVLAIDKPDPKA